jgi:hypothetical protein
MTIRKINEQNYFPSMKINQKELLEEIDLTLQSLEEHVKLLNSSSLHLTDFEVDALKKTQESLLARLIHRDELLQNCESKTLLKKTVAKKLKSLTN